MLNAKRMLAFGLSALAALALTAAVPPPGVPAHPHGPLLGAWNLPGPLGPGHTHAKFFDEDGATRYVLDAQILHQPGGLPGGLVKGVVRAFDATTGTSGAPVAIAHGHFKPETPGHGSFRIKLIAPSGPTGHGPQVIGFVKGTYQDPPLDVGLAKGGWILFGSQPAASVP